jgi:hypothetical protein
VAGGFQNVSAFNECKVFHGLRFWIDDPVVRHAVLFIEFELVDPVVVFVGRAEDFDAEVGQEESVVHPASGAVLRSIECDVGPADGSGFKYHVRVEIQLAEL